MQFAINHAAILGQTMAINAITATFIMLQPIENITQPILICKSCIFLLASFLRLLSKLLHRTAQRTSQNDTGSNLSITERAAKPMRWR
jgi:hypothetical protein